MPSEIWSIAVVVGPILLGLAVLWGFLQSRKRERDIDPIRSGSDPSFGMEGADVSPDTIKKDARTR
jgi:hypothetical protein